MANSQKALGLIEVVGYPAAVTAADAALKAANIQLAAVSKVGSGIVTVSLLGDVGAISAAVDAGTEAVKDLGELRASHVIPGLSIEVWEILAQQQKVPQEAVEKEQDLQYIPADTPSFPIEDSPSLDAADYVEETAEFEAGSPSFQELDGEDSTENNAEYEELKKRSNQQLRRMAMELASSPEETAPMKYWNKNNLIQFILNQKAKEMPDGTER